MALEEILQEHIKALNENTRAIVAYTNALLGKEDKSPKVEHTKNSACRFCGVTYKTFQNFIEDGSVIPSRREHGKREFFRENELVILCESKGLFGGVYGELKTSPRSAYYAG